MLGQPGVVLLDVRPEAQWRVSEMKLPGAVHEDPAKVQSWAHKYPKDAKIVLY
jgi:rhodanese-related sulfurtransferase